MVWKKKSEFNDLLSLAAKGSYFVFNNIFYKQIVRSAMANAGLLWRKLVRHIPFGI